MSGVERASLARVKTQVSDSFPDKTVGSSRYQSVLSIFFRLIAVSAERVLVPMCRLAVLQIMRLDSILKIVLVQLDACILIGKLIRR